MANNLGCLFISLAVMNIVLAQNSTENSTDLQWLNSLLLVPSVDMQNVLLAANSNVVNLNPGEVTPTSCVDDQGRRGVCVLHYQCQPTSRSLIKDGATIIDVRENEGACPDVLEVCCLNISTRDNIDFKEKTHNSADTISKCNLLTLVGLLLYCLNRRN
ncbi:uncharacterized protein LOC121735505 isoform X2 [Aricia agestis]|uniref:uncharacterized protein LOC121735505 isoform X2 n=1 Tax=Aricia agestis TaxID=91739 RepID=UPI001C20B135|nr:uncharacterized protein LOC121735505 isoform X2 [Aricia agestis]